MRDLRAPDMHAYGTKWINLQALDESFRLRQEFEFENPPFNLTGACG